MRRFTAFALPVALLLSAGCTEQPDALAELSGATMGTRYSIKLTPPPDEQQQALLAYKIDNRLAEIDRLMSTYRPDSDLMRFNQARSTDWQAAPAALVGLVGRAQEISRRTDGAYDVTVGPLVNLWGFGAEGRRGRPPTGDEIADRRGRVGYRHLETRQSPPALRKDIAGLEIDLSSIAKGWAVDQLADLLRRSGYDDFLVEVGGELVAAGEKRAGVPWHVAIERPVVGERVVQRVVPLHDIALATSGDYRNFFEDQGVRYSHTVDPRTGLAVRHRLASVTVFAEDCAAADAWATALMALGDERGPAVAEQLGLQAFFLIRDRQGFTELASSRLAAAGWWRDRR